MSFKNSHPKGREFIYCPSYGSLFFALYLKQNNFDIRVITHNESIIKFCNKVSIPVFDFQYPKINLLFNPINYLRVKKNLDQFIKTLEFSKLDQFYLFDNAFEIFGFYITQQCSKKSNVNFYLLGREFPYYNAKRKFDFPYIIIYIQLWIFRIMWGLYLVIRNGHGNPIFGIDDTFIKRNHILWYPLNKNLIELKMEVVNNFSIPIPNYHILIASDGNMVEIVNEKTVCELYHEIGLTYSSLVVKSHPRVKFDTINDPIEASLNNFEQIPEYIPVELVLKNIKKCVISVFSSILPYAVKMSNIKAISLLDLIEWNDEEYKIKVKSMLIQESNNKIFFPQSIQELYSMIENS